MAISTTTTNKGDELICWLQLLEALHQNEWELQKLGYYNYQLNDRSTSREQGQLVRPAVRLRERSWDFMSPDIVRPVAITTVSDIATIARRLGMSWKTFRPEDGVMRAEGNGHVITSTLARSVDVVLHYQHVGGTTASSSSKYFNVKLFTEAEIFIPTREADMMAFGILPGYNGLNIPTLKMGTLSEVLATMDILDPTSKGSETLRNIGNLLAGKWDAHYTRGFTDLISLAAPMLRRRKSPIIRLPTPMKHCFGLTSHREGFVVFHSRLKEYIAQQESNTVSARISWVLQQYETLKAIYPAEWEFESHVNEQSNARPLSFLDAAHTV